MVAQDKGCKSHILFFDLKKFFTTAFSNIFFSPSGDWFLSFYNSQMMKSITSSSSLFLNFYLILSNFYPFWITFRIVLMYNFLAH